MYKPLWRIISSVPCFHSVGVMSVRKSSLQSNIGLQTDFYQKETKYYGEINVKWSDLAQLETEWRAMNVYLR